MPMSPVVYCERLASRVSRAVLFYRAAASLTQAQLAQRAGVTVETVARLERVMRGAQSASGNPSLDTLGRLSFALGIEASELLCGADAKPAVRRSVLGLTLSVRPAAKAKPRAKRIGKRS